MKYQSALIIAIMFLAFGSMNAQHDLGIRFQTGIQNQNTESTYLISAGKSVDYKLELSQISNTQSVGVYSLFNFGWLYFQPEVLYTKYDVNYMVQDFNAETDEMSSFTENFQQIDVPINAGIRYKNFRFGGGPVFHMIQELNSDLADLNNLEIKAKNLSAGFQAGVGFDWKIVHFDLKYQTDFNSVSDHITFGSRPTKLKTTPSSVQFGMAIALGNKKKK